MKRLFLTLLGALLSIAMLMACAPGATVESLSATATPTAHTAYKLIAFHSPL